jgi:hypothetical protein
MIAVVLSLKIPDVAVGIPARTPKWSLLSERPSSGWRPRFQTGLLVGPI